MREKIYVMTNLFEKKQVISVSVCGEVLKEFMEYFGLEHLVKFLEKSVDFENKNPLGQFLKKIPRVLFDEIHRVFSEKQKFSTGIQVPTVHAPKD